MRSLIAAGALALGIIAHTPQAWAQTNVTLFGTGIRTIWRGTVSGTRIAWEDITFNAPKWQDLSVSVLKGSGDVIVGGGVGGWILSPPAGYAIRGAASVWGTLPVPVRS